MERQIKYLLKSGWLRLYLGDTMIGKLRIRDLDQIGAFIEELNVKPKYQNQGHGKFLYDEAVRLAIEADCKTISLYCACINTDAIRFYEREGMFIVYATGKKVYYLMTKQI